jgi:hypothetical protein
VASAGLLVAYLGVKAIVAVAFHNAHYVPIDAAPSLPVFAFAFALSLVTGALFGTAPAWLTSHADPAEALRGANRSTRDRSSLSQKVLVVVQATLSVVLLTGAGLLTRSLVKLQHQDFGYQTDHRVVISLTAPYSPIQRLNSMPCTANCKTASRTFPASSAPLSRSTLPSRTTGANSSSARVIHAQH